MKLQEVNDILIQHQDEKHKFLQNTQKYFLLNGFQPYVWIDENHKLRVKHKYRRNLSQKELIEEKERFHIVAQNFADEQELIIRFSHELGEVDRYLPEEIQVQWSTEFIMEV